MTLSYTNITLFEVDQGEAAEWLAENGCIAAVSPMIDGITVVYENVLASSESVPSEDEADDINDGLDRLLQIASESSYELGCVSWLVIVEGDVLAYSLFEAGELLDSYGIKAGEAPEGGDAEVLADAIGCLKRTIRGIRTVLVGNEPDPYERHKKLLNALQLPNLAAGLGYHDLVAGALPIGVESADEIVWIEPDNDEEEDNALL
ncbi:MAG: hypothetical protein ACOYL5_07780 [Phototrophicaceae bacterium]|jgi:hypothetical protein